MNYMKECAQLTQRYLKEVHNRDLTIEQILERPHYRQVWFWWKAKEHYEGFVIQFTMDDVKRIYS